MLKGWIMLDCKGKIESRVKCKTFYWRNQIWRHVRSNNVSECTFTFFTINTETVTGLMLSASFCAKLLLFSTLNIWIERREHEHWKFRCREAFWHVHFNLMKNYDIVCWSEGLRWWNWPKKSAQIFFVCQKFNFKLVKVGRRSSLVMQSGLCGL